MPAEDQAVEMAIKISTAAIDTVQHLIMLLLQSINQARQMRNYGGKKQDGVLKKLSDSAANKIDGHGTEGIVSAKTVRGLDPDNYKQISILEGSVEDNREDIKKLKNELAAQGVGFAVFTNLDKNTGKPVTVVGLQARDLDLMSQALINAGVEKFGMNREELEAAMQPIPRVNDEGKYPRAFERNGVMWKYRKGKNGAATWVGKTNDHGREEFTVELDPSDPTNKATFSCTRNGENFVTPMEIDASMEYPLWSESSDGTKKFYNEMASDGAAFAAAPNMALEAAVDRGCFSVFAKRYELEHPEEVKAVQKDAETFNKVSGKPDAAPAGSPVAQAEAASEIAAGKHFATPGGTVPKPGEPTPGKGPHR